MLKTDCSDPRSRKLTPLHELNSRLHAGSPKCGQAPSRVLSSDAYLNNQLSDDSSGTNTFIRLEAPLLLSRMDEVRVSRGRPRPLEELSTYSYIALNLLPARRVSTVATRPLSSATASAKSIIAAVPIWVAFVHVGVIEILVWDG